MFKNINKNGQGLLEVMAAIYIIIVGLLSIFNLSVFNGQMEDYNHQMFIASNLARQGIEEIRNIRDTNWILQDPEDPGFYDNWSNNLIVTTTADFLYEPPEAKSFLISNQSFVSSTAVFSSVIFPIGMSWEDCISATTEGPFSTTSTCKLSIIKKDFSNTFYDYALGVDYPNIEPTNFYQMIFINEICGTVDHITGDIIEGIITEPDRNCSNRIGLQVISRVGWYGNDKMNIVDIEESIYNWKFFGEVN